MKNKVVKAKCIDLSIDGQGIAKADDLVVFVKGMIPGEEGDVKLISLKKNFAFGIIDKLDVTSPYRINPICKIAYKCGGCDLRHIDYEFGLKLKNDILKNTFKNLDVEVLDMIKDDDPFYYRNKVQIPCKDHEFGFYRKFSNDIVEFDDCFIQSKLSNEIFFYIKSLLLEYRIDKYFRHILIKHAFGTNEILIGFIVRDLNIPNIKEITEKIINRFNSVKSVILNLNTRDDNVILGDKEEILYGNDYIIDEFGGIKVKISLKSFYQTNQKMMIKLYDKVIEYACLNKDSRVLDLYSGIGSISLYLASYVKEVIGVEIVESTVQNALDNVRLNNVKNVTYVLDDATKNFKKYLKDIDVLIVDPPRKGISKELIEELNNNIVSRIVYVSCNPATLARDLELLKDKYYFDKIQPVDMFPWTVHSECVCVLNKK